MPGDGMKGEMKRYSYFVDVDIAENDASGGAASTISKAASTRRI